VSCVVLLAQPKLNEYIEISSDVVTLFSGPKFLLVVKRHTHKSEYDIDEGGNVFVEE